MGKPNPLKNSERRARGGDRPPARPPTCDARPSVTCSRAGAVAKSLRLDEFLPPRLVAVRLSADPRARDEPTGMRDAAPAPAVGDGRGAWRSLRVDPHLLAARRATSGSHPTAGPRRRLSGAGSRLPEWRQHGEGSSTLRLAGPSCLPAQSSQEHAGSSSEAQRLRTVPKRRARRPSRAPGAGCFSGSVSLVHRRYEVWCSACQHVVAYPQLHSTQPCPSTQMSMQMYSTLASFPQTLVPPFPTPVFQSTVSPPV